MDASWVDRHTVAAPAALRVRVRQYLSTSASEPRPNELAVAADSALARVLDHPGDRSVALDLLAADALITLALLAQAQTAPDQLEEFAISVLRSWRSKA
ncbi:MAG TPA: hypothetical protein VK899_00685 [Gemmatimonadales bacterium]|nr:hypothetical protein [Gemmatimonadales bacterium]